MSDNLVKDRHIGHHRIVVYLSYITPVGAMDIGNLSRAFSVLLIFEMSLCNRDAFVGLYWSLPYKR